MDMQLLGETIATTGSKTHYGFWMSASGNDGVGGIEVFFCNDATAFTVTMETKSSDDPDSVAAPIGSVAISAVTSTPDSYKFDVADAQDLVRYVVTSSRSAVVHLQFAQPLWHPN